jgi:hypothetical protein
VRDLVFASIDPLREAAPIPLSPPEDRATWTARTLTTIARRLGIPETLLGPDIRSLILAPPLLTLLADAVARIGAEGAPRRVRFAIPDHVVYSARPADRLLFHVGFYFVARPLLLRGGTIEWSRDEQFRAAVLTVICP